VDVELETAADVDDELDTTAEVDVEETVDCVTIAPDVVVDDDDEGSSVKDEATEVDDALSVDEVETAFGDEDATLEVVVPCDSVCAAAGLNDT
jgi:hypothetical protein